MDAQLHGDLLSSTPQDRPTIDPTSPRLSRRRLLYGAALTGGGLLAAGLAACAPTAAAPRWTYAPPPVGGAAPSGSAGAGSSPNASAMAMMNPVPAASAAASSAASLAPAADLPAGWTQHDVDARAAIRRYIGNLAPALKDVYGDAAFAKLAAVLGAADDYPELKLKPSFAQVPNLAFTDALKPLAFERDGDVKVFRLTIDEIHQSIDELKPPVAALGYNGQWPGPTIRATIGDKLRFVFTNNLKETTGVHFHGVEQEDFFQDGVPFVTQLPIVPGASFTYEFTATTAGSLMYHSHHNASDQVGRGLLGAFIVEPKTPVKVDRDYIWISNDSLGGFTINGHGFPAVVPVLAATGETVRIRFMNEGIMMHPWHLHGYKMRVIERDGHPLGTAEFDCDTLGVNPGERYDVLIKADRPGVWAFHCHILPHVEGTMGMFGMVSTLLVVPEKAHVAAIVNALIS